VAARRRTGIWLAAAVVVVALAAVTLIWFQPQKLFYDERVDESLPTAAEPPADGGGAVTTVAPPGPVDLTTGTFVYREHDTVGTARVVRLPDGQVVVRLDGFETSNGPALFVYLSQNPAAGERRRSTSSSSTSARSRATSVTRTTPCPPVSTPPRTRASSSGATGSTPPSAPPTWSGRRRSSRASRWRRARRAAGAAGHDPPTVYPAARLLGAALLVPLALASLLNGVALGLLTPWGLVRYWWVAIKLTLTTAGTVLALVLLTTLVLSVVKPFGRIRRRSGHG
jgi:Electron transfer DM13